MEDDSRSKGKGEVTAERRRLQMERFNAGKVTQNTKQTVKSRKKTIQSASGLLKQKNS